MSGPEFVTGNIVRGDDLWDREDETAAITAALEKGSILLKAPRRYGKSSLMNKIYDEPPAGWTVFYMDAEGFRTPAEFIAGVGEKALKKLPRQKARGWLTKGLAAVLNQVDELSLADFRIALKDAVRVDWREHGKSLVSVLAAFNSPVSFMVDEFPVLVANIERHKGKEAAVDFLHWFRSIRQDPVLANVRWVAAGSIAIETIVQRVGARTEVINDFDVVTIGPFEDGVARSFIQALVRTEGRVRVPSEELAQQIVDVVGTGVPFFLQVLVKESVRLAIRGGYASLNMDIVKEAYFESVLGPSNRTYFDHFYERLGRDLSEEKARVAKRLILEVAKSRRVASVDLGRLFAQVSEGRLGEADLNEILIYIENEYYVRLDPTDDAYCFSTNLLRDWWLRYHDQVEVVC